MNGLSEKIQMERKEQELRVVLPREIDHHGAVGLRREIDEAVGRYRPRRLRIDASEVEFMDSSGLGLLMGRLALMKKIGGELILTRPSGAVMRMVYLSGMERLLCIESTGVNKERSKHA